MTPGVSAGVTSMARGYLNSKVSGLGWLKNGLSWDCPPNVQALQHGRLRVAGVSGFQDEHPQERGRSSMAFYDSASEDTWLTGDFPHALPASAVITARLKGMESQNPPLDGRRGENVQPLFYSATEDFLEEVPRSQIPKAE